LETRLVKDSAPARNARIDIFHLKTVGYDIFERGNFEANEHLSGMGIRQYPASNA